MINYVLRLILTGSSIAPVCFTVSFIGFMNNNYYLLFISLSVGILICFLGILIIFLINNYVQILKKKLHLLHQLTKKLLITL